MHIFKSIHMDAYFIQVIIILLEDLLLVQGEDLVRKSNFGSINNGLASVTKLDS